MDGNGVARALGEELGRERMQSEKYPHDCDGCGLEDPYGDEVQAYATWRNGRLPSGAWGPIREGTVFWCDNCARRAGKRVL